MKLAQKCDDTSIVFYISMMVYAYVVGIDIIIQNVTQDSLLRGFSIRNSEIEESCRRISSHL